MILIIGICEARCIFKTKGGVCFNVPLAGIVPTDEMFQRKSRRVLHGDEDDAWNTTMADNADWLNYFQEQIAYEKEPDVSGSG